MARRHKNSRKKADFFSILFFILGILVTCRLFFRRFDFVHYIDYAILLIIALIILDVYLYRRKKSKR